MGSLGPTEIIIIAIVIMVLFGAKRLPEAARSLGRSARILKADTKGLHDDDAPKAKAFATEYKINYPVLLGEGLKWRQEETWFGARVDPEFERKRGRSSASTPPHPTAP